MLNPTFLFFLLFFLVISDEYWKLFHLIKKLGTELTSRDAHVVFQGIPTRGCSALDGTGATCTRILIVQRGMFCLQ